jgi:BlaI family transcriptional regulator, penicillinase repressor
MARPASTHPTDGELEILRVLWERGPLPLGEVCESLRRQREVATTTVATMLRVMLDKRLVKRKQSGRAAEWSAN